LSQDVNDLVQVFWYRNQASHLFEARNQPITQKQQSNKASTSTKHKAEASTTKTMEKLRISSSSSSSSSGSGMDYKHGKPTEGMCCLCTMEDITEEDQNYGKFRVL
jgi:hypothetical protein